MREFRFDVEGRPAPQGSKSPVGGGRMKESSKYLPAWRKAVVSAAVAALSEEDDPFPLEGALVMQATFRLRRGKTVTRKYPTTVPDLDKLERSVGDALKIAGVVKDDCLFVENRSRKVYAGRGRVPGATVRVYELSEDGDWGDFE